MKEPKGEIRSVGKAMELLELFFAWRKPMSLQQLAEATQYPKSTVHSLLATLREYGVVMQEESGRYYLGARLYEQTVKKVRNRQNRFTLRGGDSPAPLLAHVSCPCTPVCRLTYALVIVAKLRRLVLGIPTILCVACGQSFKQMVYSNCTEGTSVTSF